MPGADENQQASGTGANGEQKEAAGASTQGAEGTGNQSKEMTPEEMKAEIAKLRKENASRRTTAKNLEESLGQNGEVIKKLKEALGITGDEEKPEVVASKLQAQNAALQLEIGIRDLALEHSVPKEHMKYFGFLFQDALSGLGEGEELGEDAIQKIVGDVKAIGAPKQQSTGAGTGKGSTPPPNSSAEGQPDAQKFGKMTLTERTLLHRSNPELYNSLFAEAKKLGLV